MRPASFSELTVAAVRPDSRGAKHPVESETQNRAKRRIDTREAQLDLHRFRCVSSNDEGQRGFSLDRPCRRRARKTQRREAVIPFFRWRVYRAQEPRQASPLRSDR